MKNIYLSVALLLLSLSCWADIIPDTRQYGNTIVPGLKSVPVSMDSEKVFIGWEGKGYARFTRCFFWMKNTTSKAIQMTVAFPGEFRYKEELIVKIDNVPVDFYAYNTSGAYYKLSSMYSGESEKREKKHLSHLDSLGYSSYIVWDVSWSPFETKLIEFDYNIKGIFSSERLAYKPGIVELESLSYIVKTGALWKGPIGKADIYVDLTTEYIKERLKHTKLVAFPENYSIKNDTISWHFKNWEPTEDISVNFCRWLGLNTVEKYSIEKDDDIQNQKTIKRYFPEKIADYKNGNAKDYACGDVSYIIKCYTKNEFDSIRIDYCKYNKNSFKDLVEKIKSKYSLDPINFVYLNPWYLNGNMNKIFCIDIGLSRIHVIDIKTLNHEGSFYIEKPRHIYGFTDKGAKAYIQCYRKTEKDYEAVAVVDLKEALKHLEKIEFYKHF